MRFPIAISRIVYEWCCDACQMDRVVISPAGGTLPCKCDNGGKTIVVRRIVDGVKKGPWTLASDLEGRQR